MAYTPKKTKSFTKAGVKAKPRTQRPTVVVAAAKVTKPNKKHPQRVRVSSEATHPKYAKKDFILEAIEKAARKEEDKESAKIAHKMSVQKYLQAKEDKKQDKKSTQKSKLEHTKQSLVQAKKAKLQAKKTKSQATAQATQKKDTPAKPAKKVRFA